MKTKLIVLLPFLLLGGVVWGQNKKASIKRLNYFKIPIKYNVISKEI
jgi:hypothetical protein